MHVLIAGGTGLIGRKLERSLVSKGLKVSILSRNPRRINEFKWDPINKEICFPELDQINVLINLSGVGIADKRWTDSRKKELYDSRIETNEFLYSEIDKMTSLRQFISSSGINCYGYNDDLKVYKEEDPFGEDYLSQLVRSWEKSADLFSSHVKVAKIRTAVVLDNQGGALKKMSQAVNWGVGSPLGSGKQMMPWIHNEDLVELIAHVIKAELEGPINAVANCDTNADFMRSLAKSLKKPFFFLNVPSVVLKLLLGEMSSILLNGLKASNERIIKSGFNFRFTKVEDALKDLLN